MADGQVDVIISKEALKQITDAITQMEILQGKIKDTNIAGISGGGGTAANNELNLTLKKTNDLIAAHIKLIKVKTEAAAATNNNTNANKKAKQAIEGTETALNKEIAALKKEQATLSTTNNAWLEYQMKILKVKNELNALTAVQNKVIITKKKERAAIKGTANALKIEIAALKKEQAAVSRSNISWKKYEDKIKKVQAELNKLTGVQKKSSSGFKGMLSSLKSVLSAFGIIAGAQMFLSIAKNVFSLVKTFDSLRFSMEKIAGNMEDAATSERFLTRITKDFGVSLVTTTNRFIKFLAAAKQSGLTLRTTENIFRSMTKAASVLGLKTDELKGIYLALEQMLSKGKVTTEELRRQLGERLPGAMGIMAASMGVTIAQLDKMLKKGEVLSAEVLPAFADAVEIAYGIDTVKKVDTLMSSQTRMTTAWQNFVKNVIDDSSKLQNAFNGIAIYIDAITKKMQGLKGSRQDEAMFGEDVQNKIIEDDATENLEATGKWIGGIEKLKKQKKEFEIKVAKQTVIELQLIAKKASKEDIKSAGDELLRLKELNSAKLKEIIDYNKELTLFKKSAAADDYDVLLTQYNNSLALFTEKEKEVETKKNQLESMWIPTPAKTLKLRTAEDDLKKLNDNLGYIEGRLSVVKKFLGEDKVSIPEEEDEGVDKTRTKKGRNIEDLTRAKQIKLLELQIKFNGERIELDNKTAEEREGVARDIAKAEVEISKLTMEQVNENNEKKAAKEIASWNEFAKTSKEARIQADGEIAKIQKEADDKEILSLKDHLKRTFDITLKWDDFLEKAKKKALDERFALSDKEFDDLRIEAASAYKLGLTDWEIYQKVLTEINRLEANARIDILIEEQKIRNKSLTGKDLQLGEAVVSSLKAGKKLFNSDDEGDDEGDELSKSEKFERNLGIARDFADAIGDIGNAIFDRKIAKIDEEIRREEEKYAILFAFAKGDANQTRLLAIQREEDLQKLEAKRRKEVKKQAKFNKAQAIVEIAINTAIAYSKAVTASPLTGGLPWTAIVSALGALQIAAVAAQPLPEFAEGGIMDHDGAAIVGDGGKREVIRTPDGKISLTPSKDTVVNIPKGTEIFPSIEDFNNEQPNDLEDRIYSATLLASISLNQKNIEGMMFSQRELDQRLLDEMIKNTKAVRDSKSNLNVKTQSIDIPHQMWKNKFLS